MSKGDSDKDETPIRFYIPRISSRGRAPIPINQPNWKYGSRGAPKLGEWIFMNAFGLIITLAFYLIATKGFNLSFWMGLIAASFGVLLLAGLNNRLYQQLIIYRNNLEEYKTRRKPEEKKQPKRRKDYR